MSTTITSPTSCEVKLWFDFCVQQDLRCRNYGIEVLKMTTQMCIMKRKWQSQHSVRWNCWISELKTSQWCVYLLGLWMVIFACEAHLYLHNYHRAARISENVFRVATDKMKWICFPRLLWMSKKIPYTMQNRNNGQPAKCAFMTPVSTALP